MEVPGGGYSARSADIGEIRRAGESPPLPLHFDKRWSIFLSKW